MRGSAQLAGAHNPLGDRLSKEKEAPESVVSVPETLSKERAGELEGEGGSLEGVYSPALSQEATWGQVLYWAPGPAANPGEV